MNTTNTGRMFFFRLLLLFVITLFSVNAQAAKPLVTGWATTRVTENPGRAPVAIKTATGVYLGWRLLKNDPHTITFNVWRKAGNVAAVKLNTNPVALTTDFLDKSPVTGAVYYMTSFVNGVDGGASDLVTPTTDATKPYISIPLGHSIERVGYGDLNGDGKMDFVFKNVPSGKVDPFYSFWKPSEGTIKLEAYKDDGTFLWTKDLGWSIEAGVWYSPYVVFDFNGDGKAEVAYKAGDGVPDTVGADSRYVGAGVGRVTSGNEYVVILNGETGKEITRVPWPTRDGLGGGTDAYNYYSRNQIGVAFLDGKTPCLILERGTYITMKAETYQLRGNTLEKLWSWDNITEDTLPRFSYKQGSQGGHTMHCVDVDGDGRDEALLGSITLDDNGQALWSTGMGHPDDFFVSDIDPARPGLEFFAVCENPKTSNGLYLADAKTGNIIWGCQFATTHVGKGQVADIDTTEPGMECFGWEDPKAAPGGTYGSINPTYLMSANGSNLGVSPLILPDYGGGGFLPRVVWWDADVQRELIYNPHSVGSIINKYAGQGTQSGGAQVGGFDGNVVSVADIIGDWREEIIVYTNAGELRIYTTTIPASDRRVTLMQDPIYRNDMAHQAMGYGYRADPMLSIFLEKNLSTALREAQPRGPQKLTPVTLRTADAQVRVYDLRGQAVAMNFLPAGMYLVKSTINSKEQIQKLFIGTSGNHTGKNAGIRSVFIR